MNTIYCKEIIVKFRQGQGMNDQRVRTSDYGGTDELMVQRSEDMLTVSFLRQDLKAPNGPQVTQKIIGWNFAIVAEFDCEGVKS